MKTNAGRRQYVVQHIELIFCSHDETPLFTTYSNLGQQAIVYLGHLECFPAHLCPDHIPQRVSRVVAKRATKRENGITGSLLKHPLGSGPEWYCMAGTNGILRGRIAYSGIQVCHWYGILKGGGGEGGIEWAGPINLP